MKTFFTALFLIVFVIWLIWSSLFFMTFSPRVKEGVKAKYLANGKEGAKYRGVEGAKRFEKMYRKGQIEFALLDIMMILLEAIIYIAFLA